MKLTVEKSSILDGLQNIQSIITQKTTLPVLSNILFKTEEDKLMLFATSIDLSVRTYIDAQIDQPGGTTLPARRISSIFRELPSHDIEIATDSHDVASIRSGASRFKLMGIAEEEFPPVPTMSEGKSYTLDQGVFKEMLRRTSYAASDDETRQVLNGVLVSFRNEKIIVVATDGRRLALVEQELEFPEEDEGEIIVPSRTTEELLRTLGDEGELKMYVSDTQVAFEFRNIFIVSKLIEGEYPNYRQALPPQGDVRIPIERELLLTAVKRVALIAKEESSTVRCVFSENQLEISTEAHDVGEAREQIPIKYDGDTIDVSYNPDFIMEPLKNLQSDEIFMELTDELGPGVIKSNVPFIYVIMPMRS